MKGSRWTLLFTAAVAICLAGCPADGTLQTGSTPQDNADTSERDAEGPTDGGDQERLRLDVFVDGPGTVESYPAGIHCPSSCNVSFESQAQITLTASAADGHRFQQWTGACSGTSATCTLTMTQNSSVRAVFECAPQCDDRECGNDDCGGSCGDCAADQFCDHSGACVDDCTPDCSARQCGSDGCGGSCGGCPGGQHCDQSGSCVCTPDCSGKECGDDGCGGSCGGCPGGQHCDQSGSCVCTPDCSGKECGDDGCGGSCGDCPGDQMCSNRYACIYVEDHCDDRCDCPPGWHCTSQNECAGTDFGPHPPKCCTDPNCASGEGCVNLDGSGGTCP